MLKLINVDVYDASILLVTGESDKAVLKWVKKNTNIHINDHFKNLIKMYGHGRTCIAGSFVMMRIEAFKNTPSNHATLAHEAFHAAEFILDRAGVQYHIDHSSESYAYMVSHIVKESLNAMNKVKKQ